MIYFIPTPIGNLEDISQRSLKVLGEVSLIFCEDTRVTKKLISLLNDKYNLTIGPKHFISFHSHNENKVISSLHVEELQETKCAFVSDAGMPSISDPGALLVQFCQKNAINYEILPGANAALLAYVASGFEGEFSFYGFLPHKGKARHQLLQVALNSSLHVILYESPHRIITLLQEIVTQDENRKIFAIKEATKLHEKKFLGQAKDVLKAVQEVNTKGEWVLVLEKSSSQHTFEPITQEDILSLSLPPKQKAKLLSKITNKSVNSWYEELKND